MPGIDIAYIQVQKRISAAGGLRKAAMPAGAPVPRREVDMTPRVRSGHRGFTLIEVLLAAIILAIILIGVGLFFTNIVRQSDIVDDQTRALELARQGLEEIRAQDVQSMTPGQTTPEVIEKFTRYYVISEADSLYPNAVLVDCVVHWSSAAGPDTLSFSTIL